MTEYKLKKRDESMEMVVNCEFVSQPLKNFERMSIYDDNCAKPNKEQREQ